MTPPVWTAKISELRKHLLSALSLIPEEGATIEDFEFCLGDLEKAADIVESIIDSYYNEKSNA